jgi:hypothetical protein
MRRRRLIVGVLISMLLLGAAAVRAETITGTFQYTDTGGLRPIAFAKVEIHRFAPRICVFLTLTDFVVRVCVLPLRPQ